MTLSYQIEERLASWKVNLPLHKGAHLCLIGAPDAVVQSFLRHDVQIDVTFDKAKEYDSIVFYGKRVTKAKAGYQIRCFMGLPFAMPRIWIDLSTPASRVSGLSLHRPGRWVMRIALECVKLLARITSYLLMPGLYVTVYSKVRETSKSSLLGCAVAAILHETIQFSTIYCGSDDQKRKITSHLCLSSGHQVIAKIADTDEGKTAILKEEMALKWLSATEVYSQVPQVLGASFELNGSRVQFQSRLPDGTYTSVLGSAHLHFLDVLMRKSHQKILLKDVPMYQFIQETDLFRSGMEPTQGSFPLNVCNGDLSADELAGMVKCLKKNEETFVDVCFAHGDFTPWNCVLSAASTSRLLVYDWEDFDPLAPMGVDIFHFLYRKAYLIGPWKGLDSVREAWLSYMNDDIKKRADLYFALSLLRILNFHKIFCSP